MPWSFCFFFQAEDGIRDAQESRGLGDVYKRQTDNGVGVRFVQREFGVPAINARTQAKALGAAILDRLALPVREGAR